MNAPDLFTLAEQRRRERELERQVMELKLALANLLAASKGVWHVQGRKAKRNAMDTLKGAA